MSADEGMLGLMRAMGDEVTAALKALPAEPAQADIANVIGLMDAYLSAGPWTEEQRKRICAAAEWRIFSQGRLA